MLMTVFLFSVSAKSFSSEQDVGWKPKTEKVCNIEKQSAPATAELNFNFCQRTDIFTYTEPCVLQCVPVGVGKLTYTEYINSQHQRSYTYLIHTKYNSPPSKGDMSIHKYFG